MRCEIEVRDAFYPNKQNNKQEMQVEIQSIVIENKSKKPYFKIKKEVRLFEKGKVVVKVLAFSIDPVMRVWLAGAKTNFRTVKTGDVFNAFGVGQVVQSEDETYPIGSYLFGNTGTTNYFQLTQEKMMECFPIEEELIAKYGPSRYLYLINNGLAAYQGYEILEVQVGETVVVSTAAGATGLLLCHLLKRKGAKILALCSSSKKKYLEAFTDEIVDYRDRGILEGKLKSTRYSKYFDNVGESMLDLVLETIQPEGIIAMCGAIQHYLKPKEGGIENYEYIISKRLKLQGIRFSTLAFRAAQIFSQFQGCTLILQVLAMSQFIPVFLQLFKSGGAVVGKVVIDPHL